jgi:hypothetical protein
MKKRIIAEGDAGASKIDEQWLDLDGVAEIEITSEDPEHPIDSAIAGEDHGTGWRAANPGEQMIRICFLKPASLRRIRIVFEEESTQRTQEFVLRWAAEESSEAREIVRQQYNFNPPYAMREVEDYEVNIDGAKVLELSITPSISGGEVCATLSKLRLC